MWSITSLLLLATAALAVEQEQSLENTLNHRGICQGMFGPEDSSGPYTPSINVTFPPGTEDAGSVSLLIYNYLDLGTLGIDVNNGQGAKNIQYQCKQQLVYSNVCKDSQLGMFLQNAKPAYNMINEIIKFNSSESPAPVIYNVNATGFYCVRMETTPGHESMKFNAQVKFQNAYGYLSAEDYPLITFHFVQSLVYFAALIIWTAFLIKHWSSVLKVQLYMTALGWLLACEQLVVSGYYFTLNKVGHSPGTLTMLILTSFWGSARLAGTMFLLLIIACGYSVVHPSLGSKMWKCQLLFALLFASTFGRTTVENLITYKGTAGEGSKLLFDLGLILYLPFIVLLTINYTWILFSLKNTILYLRSRKQIAKAQMYRFLAFIVIGSFLAIALQFLFLIFQFAFESLDSIVTAYWRSQWIVYDGWPNIVYCAAFFLVMFLWRPNKDNMRYAMSTQLAQSENDADEFEIGSLNGSDDELEVPLDEEAYGGNRSYNDRHGNSSHKNRDSFDASADNALSDLDNADEFEVNIDDRNVPGVSEALVKGGSPKRSNKRNH